MLRTGFIADGALKMAAGLVMAILTSTLGDFFHSPAWLVIGAGLLLFLSGATEISFAVTKADRAGIPHLIGFAALWMVATVVAVVLAFQDDPMAGWIWFGAIGAGSLYIAVVFTTGANGPDPRWARK